MYILFFIISFIATTIGSLCGIGGGVIIKPSMDATGLLSVASVSFLSSATVLSMALVSVITTIVDSKRHHDADTLALSQGTPLAIGAAVGGILGKTIFQNSIMHFSNGDRVGAIQAGLLIVLTFSTIIYNKKRVGLKTHHLKNRSWSLLIGLLLGMKSAFIGIGGGPINIVILTYFYSMPIKKAAVNSLYIIMFSQLAGLLNLIIQGHIPQFHPLTLILMCLGGVFGGFLGKKIHKRVSSKLVHNIFNGLLVVIFSINIYNLVKFIN